jgi:hypothetical protein
MEWYENRESGLGQRFFTFVKSLKCDIEYNPFLFAEGYRKVREAFKSPFPYVIRFRILKDYVDVFACTHEKRHSSAWRSRI